MYNDISVQAGRVLVVEKLGNPS